MVEKHEELESHGDHAVKMVRNHLTNICKVLLECFAVNCLRAIHVAENEK